MPNTSKPLAKKRATNNAQTPHTPEISSTEGLNVVSPKASPLPRDGSSSNRSESINIGMVMETLNTSTGVRNTSTRDSQFYREHGANEMVERVSEAFSNLLYQPEEPDLIIERLCASEDARIRRTFIEGYPVPDVINSAISPRIGLVFLQGSNLPQVNRQEQNLMHDRIPEQQSAQWRINTASTLLHRVEVLQDLTVVKKDQTAEMIQAIIDRRAIAETGTSEGYGLVAKARTPVTMDSERVRIVNNLRGDWEMQATLIEVDGSALQDLMIRYRYLINRGGPDMSFEETRMFLDTMIEDARRLCMRSPVLFRMSTRQHIINSENTRYGTDKRTHFQTLITSEGVREIISMSASYYNSLDAPGSMDTTQMFIRPRFLQMLILLLSFLNNKDLEDMKMFLESTYKIRADRRHLEILFLKVLPLLSINEDIFIESLVPAADGVLMRRDRAPNPQCWDILIHRLLVNGFLLPGGIDDLGRPENSWVIKWNSFKSSHIFDNLQYAGCHLRTVNDISPIVLRPESHFETVNVIMNDKVAYTVTSEDLERITCLVPGVYTVTEVSNQKNNYDLEVSEAAVNVNLAEAIQCINILIPKLNQHLIAAGSSHGPRLLQWIPTRRAVESQSLGQFIGSGRVTRNVALLNQDILAVTYKIDGRKTTRNDVVRSLAKDARELREYIKFIEKRVAEIDVRLFGLSAEKRQLKHWIDNVIAYLNLADQERNRLGRERECCDEPIAKVLYPNGIDLRQNTVWHDYRAWFKHDEGMLHIEGKQYRVESTKWNDDDTVDVSFYGFDRKFVAAPIHPIDPAAKDHQIRRNDRVTLAGKYMIVGEDEVEGGAVRPLMVNYLRITQAEEKLIGRRGANRKQQADAVSVRRFI